MILVSVASIGIGSSIYHPEATRMARYASGNRQGLAQGIFQVGGQYRRRSQPTARSSHHCPTGTNDSLLVRIVGNPCHGADDRDRSATHRYPYAIPSLDELALQSSRRSEIAFASRCMARTQQCTLFADVLEIGLRREFSILLHLLSHRPLPCPRSRLRS